MILLLSVIIREIPLGDTPFLFSFSKDSGLCICEINTDHIYYENFVEKMDDSARTAFQLLIASFVRATDEAPRDKRSTYRSIMHEWNYKMNKYISKYLGIN